MDLQKVKVSEMNPAPYNPRVDLQESDPEYQHIKNSIESFGLLDPVVWNKRTGNIVSGHQRFKIMVAGGATELDCVVVDFDEDKEKACNLAMNKAVGLWDSASLDALLEEMKSTEFDMGDFGFAEIIADFNVDDFFEEAGEKAKDPKTVVCPHCGKEFEI